ncbi:MAG TPA: TetR/AcrR family transcriptional regulator [Hymenobacter sp.]|jgi:TetR/AcrR family transcriptional repressor of nem operon
MPIQKITRKELLRTCIQVFRKQGYYRTSIQDLAQATGLTKGVFYHHFASKEEIMHTV